jgi:hypothetical protein
VVRHRRLRWLEAKAIRLAMLDGVIDRRGEARWGWVR